MINQKNIIKQIRRNILEMAAHSAHVAVALSCVEIIYTLYFETMNITPETVANENRDIFVLSKGHGCMALYSVLAERGFLDKETLKTYSQNDSILAEHPLSGKVPGVEFASGTLGHGLAFSAGVAKARKLTGSDARTFVLLGDGECDEGSVWEAVAASTIHHLDNLTAIIDWNGLQACGTCKEVSHGIHLPDCWKSFGWQVVEADGHNYDELEEIFSTPNEKEMPRVVFCRTIKGKGIDFMENNLEWHYRPVRGEEKVEALKRLDNA